MATVVQTATIVISAKVSNTVVALTADLTGVWFPAIGAASSGQVFVQGSPDTSSGNFVRLGNSAGSGDWTWSVGIGSKAITLQDVAFPFAYLRLETTAAQVATIAPIFCHKVR